MGSDGSDSPGYGANLLGAMSISSIVNQILEQAGPVLKTFGIDLDVLITIFVVGTMIAAGWHYVGDFIDEVVSRYYKCTVRITSEDAMFAALMEFLDEHRVFGTADEQVSASSEICGIAGNRRMPWYAKPTRNLDANMDKWDADYWDSDSDSDDDDMDGSSADNQTPYIRMKKKIKYAPMTGFSHYFYFKPTGHTVQVRRSEPENSSSGPWWRRQREYVSLSIYDRNPAPLKALLQRVCDRENKKNIGRTTVFKAVRGTDADNAIWERCFSRAARPIHTVILDEEQKEAICQDMAEYLMPATSKWYANRGLPYRRGYLLYGPPGTGKTSLTVSLAGKYGLQVYSLSLSAMWMNDDTLAHLFSRLPKTCIVLLEDIDACGVTREGNSDSSVTVSPSTSSIPKPPGVPAVAVDSTGLAPTRVTFSGLLNAIDGVASKEGRLLIMTTNHRDHLDEALIRPGRVDLQIKFDFADKTIIHDLFKTLYTVDTVDKEVLKFPKNFPDDKELGELAAVFSEKVPAGVFSPAEVQGLLLRHKKEPRKAVEVVEDWVAEKLAEKSARERKEAERKAMQEEKEAKAKLEKEKLEPVVNGEKGAPMTNGEKEKLEPVVNGEKGAPMTNGEKENEVPKDVPTTNGAKESAPLLNGKTEKGEDGKALNA